MKRWTITIRKAAVTPDGCEVRTDGVYQFDTKREADTQMRREGIDAGSLRCSSYSTAYAPKGHALEPVFVTLYNR